ncbi:flagellar biosynthetic protein FliO [Alishewanella sp. d11]|uniref:flagellar biosynthetic protein FliO n=1 Tax=Alishewanella sp. d11 TaxID=3414030 RepID=UPI003BF8D609
MSVMQRSSLFALLLLCSAFIVTSSGWATTSENEANVVPEQQEQQVVATELVSSETQATLPAVTRDSVLNPGASANSAMSLSKIVISLALVILLVLGLGWMFKKLSLRLPGNRQIKVICALPLGQRERILVIEIQGKQRVVGVTPHSINLLFELENPLPEEKLASDFHTQLQSFLKK